MPLWLCVRIRVFRLLWKNWYLYIMPALNSSQHLAQLRLLSLQKELPLYGLHDYRGIGTAWSDGKEAQQAYDAYQFFHNNLKTLILMQSRKGTKKTYNLFATRKCRPLSVEPQNWWEAQTSYQPISDMSAIAFYAQELFFPLIWAQQSPCLLCGCVRLCVRI